jgi:hypothetical protein
MDIKQSIDSGYQVYLPLRGDMKSSKYRKICYYHIVSSIFEGMTLLVLVLDPACYVDSVRDIRIWRYISPIGRLRRRYH